MTTALLAGCGGDDEGDGGSSGSASADQSPQQILDSSREALSKVKSFHMEGTGVDREDGEQKITGDFSLPGKLQVEIESKQGTAELLLADKQLFFRADETFWKGQGLPEQALSTFVDKWVKAPAELEAEAAQFESYADPAKIGRCLLGSDIGTLAEETREDEVGGTPAVVIKDTGDKPGTSPGELYVATEGEPLPLRAVQTGPNKPGGQPDAECGETEADGEDTVRSDLTLSKFDEPVDIKAPADAIDLEALQQQGGETAS